MDEMRDYIFIKLANAKDLTSAELKAINILYSVLLQIEKGK